MNGLARRRIENAIAPGARIHLTIHDGPDDRDEYDLDGGEVPCCMAGAMHGPRGCTCWEPVFDLEQDDALQLAALLPLAVACCHDCAYRNGSPERGDGYTEELVDLSGSARDVFACHQGMRRVVAYRHPNGRELPAKPGDYQPPIVAGRAYKADGSPAELCAGYLAHRRALGLPEPVRCPCCLDGGHVCENHPERPWSGIVGPDAPNACGDGSQDCGGAGMPCPACCSPVAEDGTRSITEAFVPRHLRGS
ncbi:MAG: hypothetical protein ACJ79H_03500 [Myxococcales bacterium]